MRRPAAEAGRHISYSRDNPPQKGERQGKRTARSAAVGAADVRLLGPT